LVQNQDSEDEDDEVLPILLDEAGVWFGPIEWTFDYQATLNADYTFKYHHKSRHVTY